jgi:small subunit ribosomal protein S1
MLDEKKLIRIRRTSFKTFIATDQEEVVDGVVVRITDRDVIVDINAKSEGVISLNEFRYNPALKVGDTVEVLMTSVRTKLVNSFLKSTYYQIMG